jgi:8-oxo-dGTP pyrophosphatase MutT (NUDIX family)
MTISRERTCTLCLRGNQLLAIEMEDPLTAKRYWSFPGGGVEEKETPEDCAVRETLEESGYQVALTSNAFTNNYNFRWNGNTYDCTTHWYMAELANEEKKQVYDEAYILQSEWLAWPSCRQLFLFNPGIIEALDYWLPIKI